MDALSVLVYSTGIAASAAAIIALARVAPRERDAAGGCGGGAGDNWIGGRVTLCRVGRPASGTRRDLRVRGDGSSIDDGQASWCIRTADSSCQQRSTVGVQYDTNGLQYAPWICPLDGVLVPAGDCTLPDVLVSSQSYTYARLDRCGKVLYGRFAAHSSVLVIF